jgi:hypothetical protein
MKKNQLDQLVPILLENEIEYYREENGGYLTIAPIQGRELKDIVFNPTVKYILACCDGRTSVIGIVEQLENKYPSVPRNKLIEDVYSTLRYFKQFGVIELKGELPDMAKSYRIGNGYSVSSTTEGDYQKIIDFIDNTKGSTMLYHDDVFHRASDKNELELMTRYNLFSFSSEFYLLEKNDEIKGLISIIGRPLKNSTVSFLNYFICKDENHAGEFLSLVVTNINDIAINKVSKIVMNIDDETTFNNYVEILSEAGFVHESTLEDELENSKNLYRFGFKV